MSSLHPKTDHPTAKMPPAPKLFGMLAEFGSPAEVYRAAEKIRDAGYKKWDVHSPFPIHGMEKAMGLKDSPLGFISLFFACGGFFGAFLLQFWIHRFAYPLLIAGKPLIAYPAYFPVSFGLGVLSATLGTIFGMFALNGLPRLYHGVFHSNRFKKCTDDGFFISIEAADHRFGVESTRSFLRFLGGKNIEVLED
jgi:hypothetical protein